MTSFVANQQLYIVDFLSIPYFVSHLAPSMSNILKCNEHQECLKTAKMGYFPMKMHDFPSIFVKSYYQQHIIMEWDVPHLQHIQL